MDRSLEMIVWRWISGDGSLEMDHGRWRTMNPLHIYEGVVVIVKLHYSGDENIELKIRTINGMQT